MKPLLKTEAGLESRWLLGVKLHLVDYNSAIDLINKWAVSGDSCHWIIQENVLTIMSAHDHAEYRAVVEAASLCVPDGLPVAWMHNLKGAKLAGNVRGPQLMMKYLEQSAGKNIKHYFLGGKPGVPEKLKANMEEKFPGIQIVGTYSPQFRPLTEVEDRQMCEAVNSSGADVLWVGLGAPKQDIWMYEHRDKLKVKVMLGVGQAFDIHSGEIKEAPVFLQKMGLEWFYRWGMHPIKFAHRYLYNNPRFLWHCFLEMSGLRKYGP